MGWSLDLFDLFIVLFIAPTIGPLFFPTSSPTISLASVYASFAVTLLMRPAGSALFGNYADIHGRRLGLLVSISGVAITTGILGCLPTYSSIGILAPISFILIRLVQGIFVGGVVASTHTLGTESITPRFRGLFSGVMASGAGIGALLASGVFTIVALAFPNGSFAVWGWRVMFWAGMLCAALSLLVFQKVEDSEIWKASQRTTRLKTPIYDLFSPTYRSKLAVNVLVTIGAGSTYYLTAGYLPLFLAKINGFSQSDAGYILILTSVAIIVASPLLGHLSEVFGRKPALTATALANLVLLPLLFNRLGASGSHSVMAATLFSCLIVILGSSGCAIALIYLNERFPTSIRASGTSLSWNVGYAVGGLMPTLVTGLSSTVGAIPQSLSIGVIAVNLLFLIGAILTPETQGQMEGGGQQPSSASLHAAAASASIDSPSVQQASSLL